MLPVPEESHDGSLRHTVVIWMALFGVLIGAFALTVIALNATIYSATGFVSSYLHALERHDLTGAMDTAGVRGSARVSSDLLVPDALGTVSDVSITSDIDQGGGIHFVRYSARVGGVDVDGEFQVLQGENRFGIFSTWSFLESPMGLLRVTPLHDSSFSVNGVDLTSAGPSVASSYQVLTPGAFTVSHTSRYLTAEPVVATVTRPGSTVPVVLDIQASSFFVKTLQQQMDDFLDECATQEVLFPTGCPFGHEVSNRVESTPKWTISKYPVVTIEPGSEPGTWIVPETQAAAHLVVDVRSLFDGTLSTFDEDVPFSVHWVMTFSGDRIDIQQQ